MYMYIDQMAVYHLCVPRSMGGAHLIWLHCTPTRPPLYLYQASFGAPKVQTKCVLRKCSSSSKKVHFKRCASYLPPTDLGRHTIKHLRVQPYFNPVKVLGCELHVSFLRFGFLQCTITFTIVGNVICNFQIPLHDYSWKFHDLCLGYLISLINKLAILLHFVILQLL